MKLSKAHKKQIKSYQKDMFPKMIAHKIEVDTFSPRSLGEVWEFVGQNLGPIFIIAAACLISYLNSLFGQFVSDDIPSFVNNTSIKSLSGLLSYPTAQTVIYFLSYKLFGSSVVPLHLTSLALHLLTTITLLIFLSIVVGKRVSALSTVVFALHPVNVESISWISGMNYPINTLLLLTISILLALNKFSKNKKYLIFAILVFAIAAYLGRYYYTALLIPAVFVIDKFLIQRKSSTKEFIALTSCAVVIVTIALFNQQDLQSRLGTIKQSAVNVEIAPSYLTRTAYSNYESIKLLVFPLALSLYHEGESINQETLYFMYLILAFTMLVTIIFFFKSKKYFGFFALIFISILPLFSPIQIAWLVAERYLYLGTIGFSVLAVTFLTKLEEKIKFKNLTLVVVVLISTLYSLRIIMRNNDWRNPKNLWLATAKVSPDSAKVHNNLGDIFAREKNFEKSLEEFSIAILLFPKYSHAYHNRGNTYLAMGKINEANSDYLKAIELSPTLYQSYFNLALIEESKGNLKKATEYINKCLEINPNFEPALILEKKLRN